ncbi:hypothetical protein PQR34_45515 [Paraburkholderia sediminicola]|uniref:hypothetical protein n=1 Tax=Paraburkholderia sediminicola TaxID=458836 RepID=UPI0038B9D361
MLTKTRFAIVVLASAVSFAGLPGCAGPARPPMPSDARIETGHITGKKLLAQVDQSSSSPVSAGVGGGVISGGGGSGFGGVGLGIDLTNLFSHPAKTQNVYEYELTTAAHQVLKINSSVELKEGECAKAVVSDQPGMSRIEASSAC